MVVCQACGLENKDSTVGCARCGYSLEPEVGEPAADEMEAMLDQLDLPAEEASSPPQTMGPALQWEPDRSVDEELSTSEPVTPLRTWLPRLPLGCVLGTVVGALPGVLLLLGAVYLETAGGPQQSKTPIGLLGLAGIATTVGGGIAGLLLGGGLGVLGLVIGWSIAKKRGATLGAVVGGVLGGALTIAGLVTSLLSGGPTTP